MNTNFTFDEKTQQLDNHDFIKMSIERDKDHPSMKKIKELPKHHCNFKFKHVNPDQIQAVLSKLDIKKTVGFYMLPEKLLKAAAPAISAQYVKL